jgi:hypothetical protein
MIRYRYEIHPRPAELGGGWRLRRLEDDEEVGGGVFPPERLKDEQANREAYSDALQEGESGLASRGEA